jgi:hypothetical protein
MDVAALWRSRAQQVEYPADFIDIGSAAVSVVAMLIKQVPAAAKFKSKLEALEKNLSQLRAENAQLQEELAQYINRWETLDGPQVDALQYLAAHKHGHAADIAAAIAANIQIAETGLVFLLACGYVKVARDSSKKPVRMRYLQSRGLHK